MTPLTQELATARIKQSHDDADAVRRVREARRARRRAASMSGTIVFASTRIVSPPSLRARFLSR